MSLTAVVGRWEEMGSSLHTHQCKVVVGLLFLFLLFLNERTCLQWLGSSNSCSSSSWKVLFSMFHNLPLLKPMQVFIHGFSQIQLPKLDRQTVKSRKQPSVIKRVLNLKSENLGLIPDSAAYGQCSWVNLNGLSIIFLISELFQYSL